MPPSPAWIETQRVARVVLAGEERVLLEPVQLTLQRRDERRQVAVVVALAGQRADRLVVVGEAVVRLELARHARVLGGDPRRLLLVVPEAGRAHARLELGRAGR